MAFEDIVTSTGLKIPTIESLKNECDDEIHAAVDPTLDVSPESPEGVLIGIFCDKIRQAYEVLEVVSNIRPEDCEGFMADFVSAVTGTRRNGATRTTFSGPRRLTVNLDDGTTLPIGSVASVQDHPDIRVETIEEVSNTSGSVADVFVSARAVDYGPIQIYAETLNVIATPVSGWNSVINTRDGEPGRLEENDTELLQRRERELRKPGTSTVPAIEVDILGIVYEGEKLVKDCTVFENTSDFVNARGMPPHSIEALVFDGIDAALPDTIIAQQLTDSKAGGIRTFGFTGAYTIDSQGGIGFEQFSRPTILDVGALLVITYNPKTYIGDDALKIIIADYMKAIAKSEMLLRFSDVMASVKAGPTSPYGVTGVDSVNVQNFAGDPFTNFQLSLRTYPLWDSSGIVLDSSPSTS